VLVLHRFSGRGKTSGLEVEQTRTKGASLFHVRDGKVTRLISYAIREEALADLGLPPETGSPPFVVVAASSEAGVSHGAKSRSARIRFTPVGREQTVFPQDAVTIDGETRDYVGRFFCPRCGSSVFARSADEIEVNVGSLDAPDQLLPTYESWIVRRESWLPPFPLKRRYDRDRDATGRFEE
jgi:hypothetical protein